MKTWENSNPIEACFISDKSNFLKNKVRGFNYISKYSFLENELLGNEDIILGRIDFEKFQSSKILVVGGGPTTSERSWNVDDYDYVFSCNHFFVSKALKDKKVDLCLICDEVNVLSNEFLNYCNKYKPYVGFEDFNGNLSKVKQLNEIIQNRVFQCVTRFQGKIGVAPKLLILATLFGAKQVDYVGIDGVPKGYKKGQIGKHSFQEGKPFTTNYSYDTILNHYKTLKDYLENDIGKNTIYNNLGEGHEYNCLSKV